MRTIQSSWRVDAASPYSIGNGRRRTDFHSQVKFNVLNILDAQRALAAEAQDCPIAKEGPARDLIHRDRRGTNGRGDADAGAEERFADQALVRVTLIKWHLERGDRAREREQAVREKAD